MIKTFQLRIIFCKDAKLNFILNLQLELLSCLGEFIKYLLKLRKNETQIVQRILILFMCMLISYFVIVLY